MHSDPDFARNREQLIWADIIVFVYPNWWGRPPAMLMGYIDQMFFFGVAYKETGKMYQRDFLRGKALLNFVRDQKGEVL